MEANCYPAYVYNSKLNWPDICLYNLQGTNF